MVRLRLLVGFSVFIFLILFILFIPLQYRGADTFIRSTIGIAFNVIRYGNLNLNYDTDYFHLDAWSWQEHASCFSKDFPGSPLTLAITTMVSGIPLTEVAFLPIPLIVSLFSIYVLYKRILHRTYHNDATRKVFLVMVILALTSFSLKYVGRFYVLGGYHTITLALLLLLMSCYVISFTNNYPLSNFTICFAIIGVTMNITCYTYNVLNLVILAGILLSSYTLFKHKLARDRAARIRRDLQSVLSFFLIASILFFEFNSIVPIYLGRAEINPINVLNHFVDYLTPIVRGEASMIGEASVSVLIVNKYPLINLVNRLCTISTGLVVLAWLLMILHSRKISMVDLIFFGLVASDVVFYFIYFALYRYGAFGFSFSEIFVPYILLTRFDGIRNKLTRCKKIGNIKRKMLGLSLVMCLVIPTSLIFTESVWVFTRRQFLEDPFNPMPGVEATFSSLYIARFMPNQSAVVASHIVSSKIYEVVSLLERDHDIYIYGYGSIYAKYLTNTSYFAEFMDSFDAFVITRYELLHGMFGDVVGYYVPPLQEKLHLFTLSNRMYDSYKSIILVAAEA